MKKKQIILSLLVFGLMFSVLNTTGANNTIEDKKTKDLTERELIIVGYIEGVWTQHENGGWYCPGSGYCCSVVGDGYKCWIMPYRSGKPGEMIEVTESQIESLRNGEAISLD